MKVSEITTNFLIDYIKIEEPEEQEKKLLESMLKAAKKYVEGYTGLKREEIEEYEDITIAVLVIVADMYDNRNLYTDYKSFSINKTTECILGMHCVNLL